MVEQQKKSTSDEKKVWLPSLQLIPQPAECEAYWIEVTETYACTITPLPFVYDTNVNTMKQHEFIAAVKLSLSAVVGIISNLFTESFGDSISVGRIAHKDILKPRSEQPISMKVSLTRAKLFKEYVKNVPFGCISTTSVAIFRDWLFQALVAASKQDGAKMKFSCDGPK